MMANQNDAVCVSMQGITKTFPGMKALDQVDFTLARGEIHALLGENGAGKSTLMKILSGMYQPTEGRILLDGQPVQIKTPRDALSRGIGMIYQNFALAPELTVLENVLLGSDLPVVLRRRALEEKVRRIVEEFGLQVELSAKVWQLSVGEQQRVEIIKAFYRGARILILDEPTAVLTPPEIAELFTLMRRFQQKGCSLVFISHKLNEALEIAGRITVFRKGHTVGTVSAAETDVAALSRMMVGRDVDLNRESGVHTPGGVRLRIQDVSVCGDKGLPAVDQVSLEVHSGEILGIAAVSGNGQAELAEAIAGLRKVQSGTVTLDTGESLHRMTARQIIRAGVGNISEKRLDRSLIPNFSIAQNLIVKDYRDARYKKGVLLNDAAIRQHARQLIDEYDIAAPDCDKAVRMLSGGNLQKVVLARELSRSPRVILAVNPTYGLDVGAIEFVQQQLGRQRKLGAAILLISEELDEVLRLSDRIVVMFRGKVAATLERNEFNRERIGLMMTGGANSHESLY